jgi:hypothetical protein
MMIARFNVSYRPSHQEVIAPSVSQSEHALDFLRDFYGARVAAVACADLIVEFGLPAVHRMYPEEDAVISLATNLLYQGILSD